MTQPRFEILTPSSVTPAIDRQMDQLYRVAFNVEADDRDSKPDESSTAGTSPFDWFVLGWVDSELVTQLALLRRQIRVGTENLWVVGVAGVATHPAWQHRGFASSLMRVTQDFLCREIDIPFGLLVCKDELRPMYEGTSWKHVADELISDHDGKRDVMNTPVMIYPISRQDWPAGEIDLCGSAW